MGYSSQSAVLKREIEAKLSSRIPAALSPQALQAARLISSGVGEMLCWAADYPLAALRSSPG